MGWCFLPASPGFPDYRLPMRQTRKSSVALEKKKKRPLFLRIQRGTGEIQETDVGAFLIKWGEIPARSLLTKVQEMGTNQYWKSQEWRFTFTGWTCTGQTPSLFLLSRGDDFFF